MNLINFIATVVLVILIVGSIYFIKNNANKKIITEYPFFVSTKDSKTNVRSGPSVDYPIIHVYIKANTPLIVLESYKEWYKVKDINNRTGWVYKNLLSKNKTAIITEDSVYIHTTANRLSKSVAEIKKNNFVKILTCQQYAGEFCKVEVLNIQSKTKIRGWVLKSAIWGDIN